MPLWGGATNNAGFGSGFRTVAQVARSIKSFFAGTAPAASEEVATPNTAAPNVSSEVAITDNNSADDTAAIIEGLRRRNIRRSALCCLVIFLNTLGIGATIASIVLSVTQTNNVKNSGDNSPETTDVPPDSTPYSDIDRYASATTGVITIRLLVGAINDCLRGLKSLYWMVKINNTAKTITITGATNETVTLPKSISNTSADAKILDVSINAKFAECFSDIAMSMADLMQPEFCKKLSKQGVAMPKNIESLISTYTKDRSCDNALPLLGVLEGLDKYSADRDTINVASIVLKIFNKSSNQTLKHDAKMQDVNNMLQTTNDLAGVMKDLFGDQDEYFADVMKLLKQFKKDGLITYTELKLGSGTRTVWEAVKGTSDAISAHSDSLLANVLVWLVLGKSIAQGDAGLFVWANTLNASIGTLKVVPGLVSFILSKCISCCQDDKQIDSSAALVVSDTAEDQNNNKPDSALSDIVSDDHVSVQIHGCDQDGKEGFATSYSRVALVANAAAEDRGDLKPDSALSDTVSDGHISVQIHNSSHDDISAEQKGDICEIPAQHLDSAKREGSAAALLA